MQVEQYYSPSTKESLTIYAPNDPSVEKQIEWIKKHKDCILISDLVVWKEVTNGAI